MPSAASSDDGVLAQLVVADGADEHDRRAEPRGGDRLVGALATAVPCEAPARDGLAGPRQARDGDTRGRR